MSKKSVEASRPKPSFGSIEPRPKNNPVSFRAVWRVDGGKQTLTFDTYTEAYDFLEEQARADRSGRKVRNVAKARTPWSEYAWAWYGARHPDPEEPKGREYYAIKKFEFSYGDESIGSITRADIQTWINDMATDPARDCETCESEQIDAGDDMRRCAEHMKSKPCSPKTVADYYQVVGQIFRLAALDGYVPDGVPIGKGLGHKFPEVEQRMIFLSESEMDTLLRVALETCPAHFAAIHVAAHTGLRQGELFGLTRNRFNPISGDLMIQQALKKRTRRIGTTKSNRHRKVALWDCCVEVLNEHIAAHDSDMIFPDRGGRLMDTDNWRHRVWDRLVTKAEFAGLHFHDLRHSHCSLLLEEGWDVNLVAERLGHKSPKMTMDVYGHVRADRQREMLAKMSKKRAKKSKVKAALRAV